MAPIVRGGKGEHRKELLSMLKQGYQRARIDGEVYELTELPKIDKNKKHDIEIVVDRLVLNDDLGNRLADSVENALKIGSGLMFLWILEYNSEIDQTNLPKPNSILTYSEKFCCPVSGFQLTEIEPRMFSFNSPFGACTACEGLGNELFFDKELVIPDPKRSIREGTIAPWEVSASRYQTQALEALSQHYKFSLDYPFEKLPQNIQEIILYGSGDEEILMSYTDGIRSFSASKTFEGVIPNLEKKFAESDAAWVKEELNKFQNERHCHVCKGYRLKQESLCVKIAEKNIGEITAMSISHSLEWFHALPGKISKLHNQIGVRVLKEITERLGFLNNVGLDYLTLARESSTLSGGESQRIRLASQIGSGLTGVLYVLDEPSIGLHQSDNTRLIATLKNLRDLGNTVIVVEHDEETMLEADYLIDVGPGAGIHGGNIVSCGLPEQVKEDPNSITGAYLKGTKAIEIPEVRRTGHIGKEIVLTGATANNLHNIGIRIPLGTFFTVTGVSGGGKSSLIIHTLYKAAIKKLENSKVTPGPYATLTGLEFIDKIVEIDQSPIGRTPRSNPATYTGAFTPIRDWFVELPESKARGYKAGRFSFNVKGGRCESCQGDGVLKIEMHFLADVYVKCDECDGARYNKETLEIKYKGKSISDVLLMTVEDALVFFEKVPAIREKLHALSEVGLNYIKIGQSATTLSGGEAQRIKLAKELSKRSTGKTLYILDEPTTGLHADDISKLLKVLHKLVDLGNTVLVIEHNIDVIKTSDLVLDIGPGGGDKGGYVVAMGTPEDIANNKDSVTGKFLKKHLIRKKC